VAVPLYGQFNINNVLAAIAVAQGQSLDFSQIQQGLRSFPGVKQRFDICTSPRSSITVVNDYAHHPTEVAATLAAARQHFSGRLLAVYRPHTYSRTKELLQDYDAAFVDADKVYLAEIESAREQGLDQSVSSQDIVNRLTQPAIFQPDRQLLLDQLKAELKPGDTVVVMTVSGYQNLAQELAAAIEGC
jgi:UDP-N-acetylmuramate--alanine ligase